MNWRRGLFRLWITLSCVWVIAVGSITLSSDYQQFRNDPWREFAQHDREACGKLPKLPEGYHCDPAVANRSLCEKIEPGPWCEFWPETTDDRVSDVIKRRENILLGKIVGHLVFILGVPLMVLALSAVGRWVVRGFRSGSVK